MSLEQARTVYPLLVQLARESAQAIKERRAPIWITYEEFCQRCKELGVNETPRTVATKLLKPLQAACLEHGKPDLSAIVIQKPRARGDTGNLLRPSDGWWEPYVESQGAAAGDVQFWFVKYREARDHEEWPDEPFF
jgi:hypothetical protein